MMSSKNVPSAKTKRLKTEYGEWTPYEEQTPENVFLSLIQPLNIKDFMSHYWEKEPLVLSQCSKPWVSSWFSKSTALDLLLEEKLLYYRDLHFCVCENGITKDLNKSGKVTRKEFARLTDKEFATVQFHQPQRFVTSLWRVLERLECFFGCLVGSNVYITPKGTQGLAPHYDDVEVFIVQLEGEKHWRLHKALVPLAREYKTNLPAEDIGKPTHEFVLKPGDVLYMPRGTVHQAYIPLDAPFSHSTHITISTYQKHSLGDYLLDVFPSLVERAQLHCVDLRKGLPLRSLTKNTAANSSDLWRPALESLMHSLFAENSERALGPPVVPITMLGDFMANRLPPPRRSPEGSDRQGDTAEANLPKGPPPALESRVRLTHPDHLAFVLDTARDLPDDSDEDEDEDGEIRKPLPREDQAALFVYSSIHNSRRNHMIAAEVEPQNGAATQSEPTILKFRPDFIGALEQLQKAREPVNVASLYLPSDEDRMHLAVSLWAEHLIVVDTS